MPTVAPETLLLTQVEKLKVRPLPERRARLRFLCLCSGAGRDVRAAPCQGCAPAPDGYRTGGSLSTSQLPSVAGTWAPLPEEPALQGDGRAAPTAGAVRLTRAQGTLWGESD